MFRKSIVYDCEVSNTLIVKKMTDFDMHRYFLFTSIMYTSSAYSTTIINLES